MVWDMGKTKRELQDVLNAVRNSGGVQSVIAKRLGVTRQTVAAYANRWVSVADAIREEESEIGDIAKSIIVDNMRAAKSQQAEAIKQNQWERAIVDTSDAKWWLRMKMSDEFHDRFEVATPPDQPLEFKVIYDR